MATTQAVSQLTGQSILQNQQMPKEGPRSVPFLFDWTSGNTYEANLINFQNQQKISIVQGMWVDNSTNPNPMTCFNPATGQTVTVLGGYQGYFPVLAVNPVDLFFSSAAGAHTTQVILYNVPIAPATWAASTTISTVVSDPILEACVSSNRMQIKDASLYTPKGYQQLTSLLAAATLTVPSGALYAWIGAESQAVRWRDDGTAPTASVGIELAAGAYFWYDGSLATIQFIQETASAKLNVSYYA